MTTRKKRTDQSINLTIGGDVVNGQIAVGSNINMRKSERGDAKAEALTILMEALKAQVQNDAPPDLQEEALEKVSALAASITSPTLNQSRMENIRAWLVKHIPALASTLDAIVREIKRQSS